MPIFVKQGRAVLYIHVPKTGGTAVEAFFRKNGFRANLIDTGGPESLNRYRRCAPQHMDAKQLMAVLRPATFDYVFMTVRNPYTRLLSEYNMRHRTTSEAPAIVPWFEGVRKRYVEDPYIAENHIRPQVDFWIPLAEVFRQEDGLGRALVDRLQTKLRIEFEHPVIDVVNECTAMDMPKEELTIIEHGARIFYRNDYLTFGY